MFPSSARGNALDDFGFGARAAAMAGAQAGDASGWAAAHHNPAGVARASDVEAAIGWGVAAPLLQINGADAGVTSPHGTSMGLAVPIPVGAVRFAFGLALYLPDQFIARIQLVPAAEPHFVLLDNNLDHLVVTPVIAAKWRGLSVGVGATVLADAAGNGVTFDVGVVGGQKVGRGGLDVSLPVRAAPVAGILFEPSDRLRFGASYRGAIDLRLALDILANVNIAGAVTGDTLISLRAFNWYTPEKVSLGASWDPLPSLTVSAELDWVRWSNFRGGVPDLHILINLGITPALVQAMFPADHFNDVFVPRIGAEWRRSLVANRADVQLRAGYAYLHTPVPEQTGLTSFVDDDRHVFAVGAGVSLTNVSEVLRCPLSLAVSFQWHELVPHATVKDPAFSPGGGFTSGGRLLHVGANLEARF